MNHRVAKASALIIMLLLSVTHCVMAQDASPATRPARGGGTNPQDRRAVKLLFDSWQLPIPPRRLIGNIYYVGTNNVSSFLITTPEGHILIDTAFETTVPKIRDSIEKLGFNITDIKFILSSHAHIDHTGGHALMKRLTGAMIVASAADAHIMETGGQDDFSPFVKDMMLYTPVKASRIVGTGDELSLGGMTLTAHLTPGHTKGATSWTTQVDEDGKKYNVVFSSSFSIVQGTRLIGNTDYPNIVQDYQATLNELKKLPCDVYFGPHGDQFGMTRKFASLDQNIKPNPFIDPEGWKRNIADVERSFTNQLAAEQSAAKP